MHNVSYRYSRYRCNDIYEHMDKSIPAPITMLFTLLQSMFEYLTGLTMLNLINTSSHNYIVPDDAFEADPFDMRHSMFVYGSAEYNRAALHKIVLCNYYHIPAIGKSLNTAGKKPDAQAAFEVGSHSLIALLAGARAFRTAGLLSAVEVYSAEIVVINREIFNYLKNVLKEEPFLAERLIEEEIREVGLG